MELGAGALLTSWRSLLDHLGIHINHQFVYQWVVERRALKGHCQVRRFQRAGSAGSEYNHYTADILDTVSCTALLVAQGRVVTLSMRLDNGLVSSQVGPCRHSLPGDRYIASWACRVYEGPVMTIPSSVACGRQTMRPFDAAWQTN